LTIFLDRQRECAVLDELFAHARTGRSGALVVRGEPGVGKSALLQYAIESASDLRVVQAVGVESEMELAFAGVHQLCVSILNNLGRLPGPQCEALSTAFGLSAAAVPDRFLIGLAVLSLLSDVAAERPLLCVVDDAQWLDQASAQALGFVARRLLAESVVVLFGARTTGEELKDVPQLVVEGLPESDARELLRSVIRGRVDDRVEDQIVAETGGNPLALLELPRGLSPAQLAGGFGMAGALSLSSRIEERFRHRFEALPDDARRLLLVAAAEPTGDPALLLRAAEQLGIASRVWAPETAGLLEIRARVRFHHPLIRSAVYRTASAEERRAVHLALAEAIDAQSDPDRRAWHLAESTPGPDEEVAAELERAADRARARGGVAAASAFLERATALTVDSSRRAERALSAAQAKYEAGLLDDALALLATGEVDAVDDLQLAKVNLLRAAIAFATRRGRDAPALLLRAARQFDAVDVHLARATYLEALGAAMFAGRLARGAGVVEVSEAVLASPQQPDVVRPTELLLHGLAVRFTEGYAAAAPILKDALGRFRRHAAPSPGEARWLWLASWVASELWDDETWALLSARQLELVRAAGALTAIPLALSARISFLQQASGELTAAASMVGEMRAVSEATGIATPPYGGLWHAALRGRAVEALELISTIVSQAEARGEGFALAITEHASAVMFNGLGRYDEALAALAQVGKWPSEIGGPTWALAELIEAAIRCRRLEQAERALERLAAMTQASGSEWALAIEARSRALLSDGHGAESLYREAIARFGRTRGRVELARAHLLYGEWLRRDQQRSEAREQLRTAHAMFTAMGVEAFVARSKRELSATGERVGKRSVETGQELTAQEDQIARLARDGLSNGEIGARLFISPRTVEYHLHKVFTKLGIGSRSALDGALPREPSMVMASQ
jgi:DNA-binding CsgD family transcriptional regulator/tetratricopeptide (TPR) repeat protein